jgi:hypothetical protein
LTRCPSPTAAALGLGPTHPQLTSMAAEPCDLRWEGFAPSTALLIPAFALGVAPGRLTPPLHRGRRRSPTVPAVAGTRGVGGGLSPGTLSAPGHTRPVSYYALFQGWLLLSQPPGCLGARTALPTEPTLGDLSRRSGLFPSRRRNLAPAVSLRRPGPTGIRSLVRVGRRQAPAPIQCSTSRGCPAGLHLNAFRGEPAISRFAWHFTPTHSSSAPFATDAGAALHALLPALQPGHG